MTEKERLPSLDNLFGGTGISDDQVELIDDSLIDEFPGHPYRLYKGKRHSDLIESITELGVLTPVILRSDNNGRYTLLSGYNRRYCNRLVGNVQLPAIIKHDISNGEAKLIITHSNKQRGIDELLPSEKAFAFKMELEGLKEMRKQAKKVEAIEQIKKAINNDLYDDSDKVLNFQHLEKSRETLAKTYGLKASDIQQLIRLTYLCTELLDLVDEGKVADYVAIPLTHISEDMQIIIRNLIVEKGYKVDLEIAKQLKAEFKEDNLTAETIEKILSGMGGKQKIESKMAHIKIQSNIVEKYFNKGETSKEIQSTIEKALTLYFEKGILAEKK